MGHFLSDLNIFSTAFLIALIWSRSNVQRHTQTHTKSKDSTGRFFSCIKSNSLKDNPSRKRFYVCLVSMFVLCQFLSCVHVCKLCPCLPNTVYVQVDKLEVSDETRTKEAETNNQQPLVLGECRHQVDTIAICS